jgi:hypothetical protein
VCPGPTLQASPASNSSSLPPEEGDLPADHVAHVLAPLVIRKARKKGARPASSEYASKPTAWAYLNPLVGSLIGSDLAAERSTAAPDLPPSLTCISKSPRPDDWTAPGLRDKRRRRPAPQVERQRGASAARLVSRLVVRRESPPRTRSQALPLPSYAACITTVLLSRA